MVTALHALHQVDIKLRHCAARRELSTASLHILAVHSLWFCLLLGPDMMNNEMLFRLRVCGDAFTLHFHQWYALL